MFWPSPQFWGTLHLGNCGSTPQDFLTRKEKKRMQMRLIIGEIGVIQGWPRSLPLSISGSSNWGEA
jgi:hypothetical protein